MITLHDLDTAIAKCQGLADPKPADAIKLAAFYIIKNEMFGEKDVQMNYSFASAPDTVEKVIDYSSDSDFAQAINGKNANDIWAIVDELMSVLQVTNVRLFNGVMRKIQD